MRKYSLASADARYKVDLRQYAAEIESAVYAYMPNAVVMVNEDHYTVSPTPDLGVAIRIGRRISRTALGQFCVQIPKLFCSEEVEDKEVEEDDAAEPQKCLGGHF